ncbi:MAG: 30S ribosomal protein S6 [Ignavibacteria bacterium]
MDKQRMYESTVIINASLEDAQVEAAIARIADIITKHGGTITELNKGGRKRLAYPINKKSNGFYVNFEFNAPPAAIGPLERSYQLDEMILRYLTVQVDKKAIEAKKAAVAAPPPEAVEVSKREPLFSEPSEQA